jgi:hypothetical protein
MRPTSTATLTAPTATGDRARARTATPALVWLSWALAAAAAVQLATNPLYVTLVVAIAALVVQSHANRGPLGSAFPVLIVAGIAFAGIRLVLTAATTHGTGDVLFTAGSPSAARSRRPSSREPPQRVGRSSASSRRSPPSTPSCPTTSSCKQRLGPSTSSGSR